MKTTHRLLILASFLFLTVVETLSLADDLIPQSNWMIALGGYNYDNLNTSVEWMGALYFAGSKDDEGTGAPNAWLLATDHNGNLLVDKAWVDSTMGGAEIKKLVARDILYAGGIVGTPDLGHDVFVMGLSEEGDILWQKQLVEEGDEILGDMILTRDGSLLLVGTNRAPGEYPGEGWVIKMDTSGNVLWQKSFGTPGVDFLRAAINRFGGGYVVAGGVGIPETDDFYQGWIMALDAQGGLLWQKAYLISNSDGFNVLVSNGAQIIGLGSALQLAYFRGDAWMVRVDSDGALISSEIIGDFDFFEHDEFVDAILTEGGDLITLGNTYTITGQLEQVWAAMIDRQGQLRGLRQYGGVNLDRASSFLSLGAEGFVFAGWTRLSTRIFDGFIVKVNNRGGGFTECDRIGNLDGELLPVYPTPVSVPTITEEVTDARIVEANLTEQISATYLDILCAD